ncbi:C3a anaphylatoxin chemotactic receptor-like [Puntigrus tetrazona]|uniref:C3a anaphylatoxin chemotactic receptor-like n=1 Tax=Puntigrus tetrazona TaxID=1606681 RepID=UPI001C8A7461|nr:C3a anaphylatoxin chemotactic receptor-like [Puntigrus tetrazona]
MAEQMATTPDYNYDYGNDSTNKSIHSNQAESPEHCKDAACVITVLFNVILFVLGIFGNGAVIWITGFKMNKSVNTTWYLSLALSDFIFCATLFLTVDYMVKNSWTFGLFMCKFSSFAMTLNMYSSIFILAIISMDRCITVKFPVWAQNQRTVQKAYVVVVLVWIMSSLLSIPPAKFREILDITTRVICYNNYENHQKTIVLLRFTFGFCIPFMTIFTCYSVLISKLRTNQISKSTKPYKIMSILIASFFICWLPYQILSVLELGRSEHSDAFKTAQQVSAALASANSCLNPFLYAFMAKDLKKKCYSFLSKIESAIDEETRTAFRATSITNSVDHRNSTAI